MPGLLLHLLMNWRLAWLERPVAIPHSLAALGLGCFLPAGSSLAAVAAAAVSAVVAWAVGVATRIVVISRAVAVSAVVSSEAWVRIPLQTPTIMYL